MPVPSTDNELVKAVRDTYSTIAVNVASSAYSSNVAAAFGYTTEQLQSIPDQSHMGLGCGNPVAAATIRAGETVLDLGSGGGIDVFLAASKVGTNGQVIGLDMSPDMIDLARRNARKQRLYPPRVAFVLASLTDSLPIVSNSVDCILSNCVINLLPLSGKDHVLKEAYRVLKPGGRIVLDDIIAKQDIPDDVKSDLASYVGCISGAIQIDQYKRILVQAGFADALFIETKGDMNIYANTEGNNCANCCSMAMPRQACFDANKFVASYQIYAVKNNEGTSALLRWWDAYPVQKASPPAMSVEELATMMRDGEGSDYAIIDVRRNDHGGGHVRGSHQWPAQTFYDTMEAFHEQFGRTSKVIFYCTKSNGRGPRCAAWYQDHLDSLGETQSKAYVLRGGVTAWLAAFKDNKDLVDRD